MPRSLSEAQVLGVLSSANQGEINEGQLAPGCASSPAVLAFAARMVTEHTAALNRVTTLASSTGLTPGREPDIAGARRCFREHGTGAHAIVGIGVRCRVYSVPSRGPQHRAEQHRSAALAFSHDRGVAIQLTTTRAAVAEHLQSAQGIIVGLQDAGAADGAASTGP